MSSCAQGRQSVRLWLSGVSVSEWGEEGIGNSVHRVVTRGGAVCLLGPRGLQVGRAWFPEPGGMGRGSMAPILGTQSPPQVEPGPLSANSPSGLIQTSGLPRLLCL